MFFVVRWCSEYMLISKHYFAVPLAVGGAASFLPKDPGPIFELAGEMGQATGQELDDFKVTEINDMMDPSAIKESSRMLKVLLDESSYDATKVRRRVCTYLITIVMPMYSMDEINILGINRS